MRLFEPLRFIDASNFERIGHVIQACHVREQCIILEHQRSAALSRAVIGDIGIHFFDEGRQAELGMTFDMKYQSQGYAREAISTIITLLFTHYNKHRLIAVVDTCNIRAANLLQKLHFRREAHYRQNIFFKGEWGDEYCYALLKEEHLRH